MKYDGYYLVEVLIPEMCSLTMKSGITKYYLCTKDGNNFHDVSTTNSYCRESGFGQPEVIDCMPLSEFYNRLGLKKRSAEKSSKSSEVYKLVQKNKKVLKKINNKNIIK